MKKDRRRVKMTNIKRGEIYLVNLGSQSGSIQSGIRPVIVISNPQNNRYSPTINVLPVTSRKKNNIPVHVDIGKECGLKTDSTILTEQVLTINKHQIIEYIGKCNEKQMQNISKAILLQFHISEDLTA